MEFIAPVVSSLALAVSSATAYFTLFRRGTVQMTQPTVIFFGPDGARNDGSNGTSKIFLRTLLFATGKRGQIVEQMFVRLKNDGASQTFNIWVYGDDKLARGSGLFVGETGVVCNHHFLLPADASGFSFKSGLWTLEVYVVLLGQSRALKLFSVTLPIDEGQSTKLRDPATGLYFDWAPDSQTYQPHIDVKERKTPSRLLENTAFDRIFLGTR